MDLKKYLYKLSDAIIAAKRKTELDCAVTIRNNSLEFDVFETDGNGKSRILTSATASILDDDFYNWFSYVDGKYYGDRLLTKSEWIKILSKYIPIDITLSEGQEHEER